MMRSCEEVARLASERLDRELTLRERLAFRMHLTMCRNCSRYARQIALVKQATEKLRLRREAPGSDGLPGGLTDEARERIARNLPTAGQEDPRR